MIVHLTVFWRHVPQRSGQRFLAPRLSVKFPPAVAAAFSPSAIHSKISLVFFFGLSPLLFQLLFQHQQPSTSTLPHLHSSPLALSPTLSPHHPNPITSFSQPLFFSLLSSAIATTSRNPAPVMSYGGGYGSSREGGHSNGYVTTCLNFSPGAPFQVLDAVRRT